jgi:hypothetical protein
LSEINFNHLTSFLEVRIEKGLPIYCRKNIFNAAPLKLSKEVNIVPLMSHVGKCGLIRANFLDIFQGEIKMEMSVVGLFSQAINNKYFKLSVTKLTENFFRNFFAVGDVAHFLMNDGKGFGMSMGERAKAEE